MPQEARWSLGIDLGGTKVHAALLGPEGQLHWQRRAAAPSGDYDGTLRVVGSLVAAARTTISGESMTVGVGGPGALTAAGVLKNANSTCLNGRPFVQDLQATLGQPVRFANDANCLALSEAVDGAGAGAEVVFAVILGTGTGAGIAVRGKVMTGPNRLAGEWGHNPLPWAQADDLPLPRCWCGQTGCLETLLSGPGLARDHSRRGGADLSAIEIAAKALAGDEGCQATLHRHSQRLARALASVINLLDPDVIVLAGGLSLMPHLVTQVPQLWGRWVFGGGASDPVRTRLAQARHGDASGVRGAAWLWRD